MRSLDSLAKPARIQFADAPVAFERHPGPLLRTDSVRVGSNLRDGLYRRERETSWRTHHRGDARRDFMHHSGLPFCRSTWPGAFRDRNLHHVHGFSALVIAFAIRGLKEFGDTSRKALIIGYSDSDRRGQMIGAYYLVRDLIVSAGAILGAFLWKLGPALNFLGAAALGVAGTVFYVTTIRQSRQSALNDPKKQLEMRRTRSK